MHAHPPLVWPDGVRSATVIHAFAGIDDEQLVHIAISVPVVQTPVNIHFLQTVHDVLYQVFRVLVVSGRTAIFAGFTNGDIVHVEVEVQLPVALVTEVIVHRSVERLFLKVLGIQHLFPVFYGLSFIGRKDRVAEGSQYHQLVSVANIGGVFRLFIIASLQGGSSRLAHICRHTLTHQLWAASSLCHSLLCDAHK